MISRNKIIWGFVAIGFFGILVFLISKYTHDTATQESPAQVLRDETVFWGERIFELGPERAYAEFLNTAPTKDMSTHDQAHAFGEALYEKEGLEGLSFCDSSFEFGCYHSFFGVAVAKEGVGILSEFSGACRARFGDYNLPCEHGIGHGVLVYTDYVLEEALALCETVSVVPTGGCSSGVFMENNFHTMDETVTEHFVRPLTDDVYAPCTVLPERFQPSCYLEQVQWWQNIYANDFAHIGTLCANIKGTTEAVDACFHGVGNYVAAHADLVVDAIVKVCATMPTAEAQALCHEGASWLVRADGSGIENAQKICAALLGEFGTICLRKLSY
ncbi:MAG: hypothetical protein RLZZ76_368 [Candidatus Parcubacteria bacterium]|jgi:hypothetical protein